MAGVQPGQLFPSGTVHSLIEFSHRFMVFIVSVLVVATAVVAWLDHRDIPSLVWPAAAAFPLVIGQAILGGIVVHTDLNPWWVTAHFAVALAFVADVIFVAANAFCAVRLPEEDDVATGGDPASPGSRCGPSVPPARCCSWARTSARVRPDWRSRIGR